MSRKLDLSMFQGDDEEEEMLPRSRALELNDLKSRTFSHGVTKKSKKDLEREAEEKKLREEEEAQARLLADFENSFDGPGVGPSGAYGGRGFGGGFVRAGGMPVAPKAPVVPVAPSGPSQPPRGPAAMGYARPHKAQARAPSPPPSGSKPRGKRAMDSFLEEIKGNQAARENRFGKTAKIEGSSISALAARETSSGNRMPIDQESTNLFVGNLPATITEDMLGRFFAEIGPVGTVKIMWPRSEMEMDAAARGKMSLTGFVAYMNRKDAETAVQELDGADWGTIRLKVGFSKWVPVPQKPLYDLTSGSKRARSRSPGRSKPKHRSRSRERVRSPRGTTGRNGDSRSPKRRRRSVSSASSDAYSRPGSPLPPTDEARERWLRKIPEERAKLVRAVADKVLDKGRGFEDLLMDREKDNPTFSFFFDDKLPEYHLYRSLLSSRYRIPTPPPEEFNDEGYASMYSSDSAEDSERERTEKGKIGRLGRKRLEAMLRVMSGKRAEIARAMEFAVKRAEAADEVAEIVCQSLKLDNTPVPRKLARLHLVSDILHNSASPIPNVWKYRLAFEKRLPMVFAHFKSVYDSLHAYSGNISADVFKAQVNVVLEVWERWIVFTQEVQDSLRDFLSGKRQPGETPAAAAAAAASSAQAHIDKKAAEKKDETGMAGFKMSGFKSSFKPISVTSSEPAGSEPAGEVGEEARDEEDVDGEPLEADLDGEPIDDDVDGEPMEEDVDGEPMEEDLDGEAM
ncbi:hypothetical protein DB88DRAFT_355185 [Papiliotrema laurentii]|uniref:U2-associated protein SR140 n=1 Tax=Papiliotrema laurentii TaxID=5418 RepID=A0AAD9FNN0_PAPLA|nr:hypothetical protein DB88DRAFT_355185 [Papiliotrema laurentii]